VLYGEILNNRCFLLRTVQNTEESRTVAVKPGGEKCYRYAVGGGFGGLEVACWPLVLKFAGSNPAEAVGFFGRKNPQHAFLRRGIKAVCPMSCFTACKRTQKRRGSRHFRQNFSAISRP
jgi:hypothetical protein